MILKVDMGITWSNWIEKIFTLYEAVAKTAYGKMTLKYNQTFSEEIIMKSKVLMLQGVELDQERNDTAMRFLKTVYFWYSVSMNLYETIEIFEILFSAST